MATTEQKFLDYPGLEYYHQQNIATMDEKDVSVLDNSKSYTDSSVQAKGNELGTRIDNLILNAGDSSAECADARVTKDGTVHDTLKNRLDTEYSQLSSEIADNIEILKNSVKVLDYTSFENGYFNVNGVFSHNDTLENSWMGHRKHLSVGNAKEIIFRHSYSSSVQLNLYGYTKNKEKLTLVQIDVEPNTNYHYTINDVYYYAVSINKDNVNDFTPSNVNPIILLIEFDCTATKEDSIIPNIPEITVSDYISVGTKEADDYSDIGVAYNAMGGNGFLLLNPININTADNGFNVQKLYMKGISRELVKLENNNAVYPYAAALIKNECVVENIHFKAGHTKTSKKGSYAIHIEHDNTQGKTMIFRNCIFESEFQSGVGVGLRKDVNLIFENCEFINKFTIADSGNVKEPDDYTTSGALFFHGSIDSANLGIQHITCKNCTFKSTGASALRIEDVSGNLVVATFIDCDFYSQYYGTMNAIDIVGGAEHGFLCGNSVKLGKMSHGNNLEQLNAY